MRHDGILVIPPCLVVRWFTDVCSHLREGKTVAILNSLPLNQFLIRGIKHDRFNYCVQ